MYAVFYLFDFTWFPQIPFSPPEKTAGQAEHNLPGKNRLGPVFFHHLLHGLIGLGTH